MSFNNLFKVRGIKTSAMIEYAMKYVRMLQSYCANIIMVFDGQSLPAKSGTEDKRRKSRENARIRAFELSKEGKHGEAKKEFDKAVVITHDYAMQLMDECRRNKVDCIVGMYEADAQLAYLNKIGLAEYIISEDSDLILFGCTKIIFKLTLDGKCMLFDNQKLNSTFPTYTFEKFQRICILSGCDYLNNLPGVGLFKAKKFMLMTEETDMKKAILKIPSYLNLKISIPDDYIENFLRAEATFKYMYVYDPLKKVMVRLNNLTNQEDEQYCVNAGELLSSQIAYQLALGNINPKTKEKVGDYDPLKEPSKTSKRAILQNMKYKPLFSLWNYTGKHQTVGNMKQQSKITFAPVKFKKPEVAKIAEEENKVEEAFEIDSLIAAYCETEFQRVKRPISVLNDNDLSTSQNSTSPKNPFAKRQSLENNTENANKCSLIKALSFKDDKNKSKYAETRVVSRFFSTKVNNENPFKVIERIEASKVENEIMLERKLDENRQFYKMNSTCDVEKRRLDMIKEKYDFKVIGGAASESNDSSDSESSNSVSANEEPIDIESIEVCEPREQEIVSQNDSPAVQVEAAKKIALKSTSLKLSSKQHRLSKFGFTKTRKIL